MTQAGGVKDAWSDAAEGMPPGLAEYVGTIAKAEFMLASDAFGQVSEWGESVVMVLTMDVNQYIDPPESDMVDVRNILSVGRSEHWTIMNGGANITPTKPGGRMGNSKYQSLIKTVVEQLKVPIEERNLTPNDALVWVGLQFRWKSQTQPIPDRLQRPDGPTESRITLPCQWTQTAVPPVAATGVATPPAQAGAPPS